jgi:hypothetical protein
MPSSIAKKIWLERCGHDLKREALTKISHLSQFSSLFRTEFHTYFLFAFHFFKNDNSILISIFLKINFVKIQKYVNVFRL